MTPTNQPLLINAAVILIFSICSTLTWAQDGEKEATLYITQDGATPTLNLRNFRQAQGEAPAAPNPKAAQADALKKFGEEAAKYEIRFPSDTELFKLNKSSLMNWTNPARRGENGAIYLWMHKGRPEVIGSIFTYVYNDIVGDKHEFHSLATERIEAEVEGDLVWNPKTPGLKFKPIPDARPPAASFTRRKIQMKLFAKRFSGVIHDEESGDANLRLIPTPLITYQPKDQACQAGAIFSLAYGTDPEILLVIECRQDKKDDAPTWKYALARYHYMGVTASLDEEKVWSVSYAPENLNNYRSTSELRGEPYISFYPR